MLGFIFRKAQATVDRTIQSVVHGAVIAVPIIVAFGFATAALAGWMHEQFDGKTANLLLAGIFLAAGGLVAAVLSFKSEPPAEQADSDTEDRSAVETDAAAAGFTHLGPADRELLLSLASVGAPVALPMIVRNWKRLLPLAIVLAVVAFIVSRMVARDGGEAGQSAEAEGAPVPAE